MLALTGLTQIKFDDDIRQLQAMPDDLKEQEYTIKNITGVGNNQQLLLVKANSEEALLQRLEQLSLQFNDWKKDGIHRERAISQSICSFYRYPTG